MATAILSLPRQLALDGVGERCEREAQLVAVALALGARQVAGWSAQEQKLAASADKEFRKLAAEFREQIDAGEDPLGDAFCRLRSPAIRREQGATFTPPPIVDAMLKWAAANGDPARVVDPGTGSGRFLVAAGERFPAARLVGIELDPLAAILARANLAARGLAKRAQVVLADYRSLNLDSASGSTLFIGNPPYVRHHSIESRWKNWLTREAARLGHDASQLAGMHVHFLLATALHARRGDYGAFITAAEWLDVNYGRLVRSLFLAQLGGERVDLIEPTAMPFPDAATTAAIVHFKVGERPCSASFRRVVTLAKLADGIKSREVSRARLTIESRWSHFARAPRKVPSGFVELGELCRVHRGQVTGQNKIWIAGPHSLKLPDSVLFASVTKARELIQAGEVLRPSFLLRHVIDLPVELDAFNVEERRAIEQFLLRAKQMGGHEGYVATNRRAWWSVGLREPAPILATYMARRPPAFVRNAARARHINIAHGLYPRVPLSQTMLSNLVKHLRESVHVGDGRTYAGGLTKFEPKEMERLLVPGLEQLTSGSETNDRRASVERARA